MKSSVCPRHCDIGYGQDQADSLGHTVARWLESAATYAARFSDRMLKGFLIRELQADEIRTFVGAKKQAS